ncbi:MAG: ABC transporter substrate-binding protein [Mariprofundaceae bacterium]|nr:ABC transporter substrate-binding protein [Mariprofundaceae bacterium]
MNIMTKGLITFLLFCFALPVWANDTEQDGPKVVVEKAVNGILHALGSRKDQSKLTEKDRAAIRQQVEGRFDYREMARRSVGRPWRKQSSEQQAAFTKTFRQLLERSYGNRLSAYHGQIVEFDNAEFKRNKARVKTRIIDSNKITPVSYRLLQSAGTWQVYDIKIEGVSLIGTFREEFKGLLKKDGFDGLLKKLQDKVARLKKKDAS